jgi:hypothetical protein
MLINILRETYTSNGRNPVIINGTDDGQERGASCCSLGDDDRSTTKGEESMGEHIWDMRDTINERTINDDPK